MVFWHRLSPRVRALPRMARFPRLLVLGTGALLASCRSPRTAPPPVANAPVANTPVVAPTTSPAASSGAPATKPTPSAAAEPPPRPLRRCFADVPAWTDAAVADLLDQAEVFFDRDDDEGALACSEEAARQAARSVEAHHDRALALARLGRQDEARDALSLLLALGPDDPESLELAADVYVNQLTPSAERAAIGLEYARRGQRTTPPRDHARHGRLCLLEGQALIDLGQAQEALRPLSKAIAAAPKDTAAIYERGVAYFELCRFDDARHAMQAVLALDAHHAHARYHLGLILERDNKDEEAARDLARASEEDPQSFPPPPAVSAPEFGARVRQALARLPAPVLRDLESIPVETADLPALDDLVAELPPLSPTILGLYRGLPLGRALDEPPTRARKGGGQGRAVAAVARPPASGGPTTCATPERTIVLYRRNLLRSVQTEAELDAAIERTLLHEVGHLRGEDDGSLRDRGLE